MTEQDVSLSALSKGNPTRRGRKIAQQRKETGLGRGKKKKRFGPASMRVLPRWQTEGLNWESSTMCEEKGWYLASKEKLGTRRLESGTREDQSSKGNNRRFLKGGGMVKIVQLIRSAHFTTEVKGNKRKREEGEG